VTIISLAFAYLFDLATGQNVVPVQNTSSSTENDIEGIEL
jgi:hypothetical protein